jgi:hypothetical protein
MLNRNDRKALRRNRSAVSWLCVLVLVLVIWIKNLYGDIDFFQSDYNATTGELSEIQKESQIRKNKIDSLINIINHKDTVVEVKNTYKAPVRKDTTTHKIDSIKPLKKDILKDTVN